MATVTLASPTSTTTTTTTTFETKYVKNNHEDSFSSYLNLIRESLAQELGVFSPSPTTMRVSIGKRGNENGELDVFQAEKYFNGLMDEDYSEKSSEKATATEKNIYKKEGKNMISLKSRSGTESSYSEGSGNSRSTLLRDSRRKSISGQDLKKSSGKKFLGVFRCSCAGRDDIKADQEHHNTPINNHATEFLTERIVLGLKREGVTIGAFSSPFIEKPVISSRRIKSSPPANFGATGGAGDINDDGYSEASSDLFEIENLNLSIHVHPLFYPEPAYEPSEASIEWSVATASVANDDHRRSETLKKAIKNHKTGLLSGCVDNKAVSVHTLDTEGEFEKKERMNSGRDDHLFALQDLPPVARYHAAQAIYTR